MLTLAEALERQKGLSDAELNALLLSLGREEMLELARAVQGTKDRLRQEEQLLFYQPVSEEARRFHLSTSQIRVLVGGNGSSKSESNLADMAIALTGVIPHSLKAGYPAEKLRSPLSARLIVESLTNTWEQSIKPKLIWNHWTGLPDGVHGHWGWIPKRFLLKGKWEESWSEKYRTLTLNRGGDYGTEPGSTLQIMCLDLNTPVLLPDGTWVPLRQIEEGDEVQTRYGPRPVRGVFRYEAEPVFKITMWGGFELIANAQHRHILANGESRRTDALGPGDILQVADYDVQTDAPAPLWKLGWTAIMIGDGYIKGDQASFTAVGGNSRVLRSLPPLPPGCKLYTAKPNKEYRVTLDGPRRDNPLVMSLKADCLWGRGSLSKFVPDWVFRQPPGMIEKFLFWLWMTDGTSYGQSNSYYMTISPALASDVQRLLWRIGKKATISKVWHQGGFCPEGVYAYHVITNWNGNTRCTFGQIRSVEPYGYCDVGCLEVDQAHEFIANGIVTGNSHGQEVQDFASASVHDIRVDEGPRHSVWRENLARLREGGYISLAMTPPDDESASWDAAWVYDELYLRGLPGPAKDPDIDSFTLNTEDNRYLAPDFVQKLIKGLTVAQREVRLHGRFLHLGGRIYPVYSDREQVWCFNCNAIAMVEKKKCLACEGTDTAPFRHFVEPFEQAYRWPCVFLLDPHPRKPNMMAWVTIDPADDWWQVAELEVDGEPEEVRNKIFDLEAELGLDVCHRVIDPNMGRSPAHNAGRREITVAEEFAAVGIRCNDSVSDNFAVGKARVASQLKPDPRLRRPRFHIFNNCARANFQMLRFTWDSWARYSEDERDPKQKPKEKNDDYPKLFGYLGNLNPTFSGLKMGARPMRRLERRAAY